MASPGDKRPQRPTDADAAPAGPPQPRPSPQGEHRTAGMPVSLDTTLAVRDELFCPASPFDSTPAGWLKTVQQPSAHIVSSSLPTRAHTFSSVLGSWVPVPSTSQLLRPTRPFTDARLLAYPSAPEVSVPARNTGTSRGRTGFVYHPKMEHHTPPVSSTECECPERTSVTLTHLELCGVTERCHRIACREATSSQLRAVHDEAHISRIDSLSFFHGANGLTTIGSDLYVSAGTARAARLAAGGVAAAALAVARGEVANAMALVRPPGHHSYAGIPSGFCFYNNAAVGVAAARTVSGVRRVMVLDWDVHHGNGTESIFYDDPDVFVVSIHQHFMAKGHRLRTEKKRPLTPTVEVNAELKPEVAAGAVAATEEDVLAALAMTSSSASSCGDDADRDKPSPPTKNESEPNSGGGGGAVSAGVDGVTPTKPPFAPESVAGSDDEPSLRRRPRRAVARRSTTAPSDGGVADDAAAVAFFASLGAAVDGAHGVAGDSSSDDDTCEEGTSASYRSQQLQSADQSSSSTCSKSMSDTDAISDGTTASVACPFYPGTGTADRVGEGQGLGRNMNVPWPTSGMGDAEYLMVLQQLVVPAAREFAPDLVIISCGFDCLAGDPLGGMRVTPTGIGLMTRTVLQNVTSRVVVALEGGYNLRNVALGSEAALRELLAASDTGAANAYSGCDSLLVRAQEMINSLKQRHSAFWKCFAAEQQHEGSDKEEQRAEEEQR